MLSWDGRERAASAAGGGATTPEELEQVGWYIENPGP
jgi:hypothetical protein